MCHGPSDERSWGEAGDRSHHGDKKQDLTLLNQRTSETEKL